MGPGGADGTYWIVDSEKQEFVDTFEAGDEIAGIIVEMPTGDRGDIRAKAEYNGDRWTLELVRDLVTGSDVDVQFDDLSKSYFFGVAAFDNAQVRHAFQGGVASPRFAPRPTAVAATSWGQLKEGAR
jgi:hypothetical protein